MLPAARQQIRNLGSRGLSTTAVRLGKAPQEIDQTRQQHEISMNKARGQGKGQTASGSTPDAELLRKDPSQASLERDIKSAQDRWKNAESQQQTRTAEEKAKTAPRINPSQDSQPKRGQPAQG